MLKCHVDSKGFFYSFIPHGTSFYILKKKIKREGEEEPCVEVLGRRLDLPRPSIRLAGDELSFRIKVAL